MGGTSGTHGGEVRTGLLCGKRPLGRPRRKWDNDIRIDLKEIHVGCVGMCWINLAQGRDTFRIVVKTVVKLGVS
jgi:hypothetical protein